MNDFSRDLIKSIDKLHESSSSSEASSHLTAELITPEWYYSESSQIFNDINTTWDSILRSNLVIQSFNDIQRYEKSPRDIMFEKSFCSWYQPYHFTPRSKWGIHLRYTSWIKIARQLFEECPSLISKAKESLVAAFLYLYYHGLFHNMTENAASMIELEVGKPHCYTTYYSEVYAESFNSLDCLEESLANSYLYKHSMSCHIDSDYLKNELLSQPDGYKEFAKFINEDFAKGCYKLISLIISKQISPRYVEPSKEILERLFPYDSQQGIIPVWLHRKPLAAHIF